LSFFCAFDIIKFVGWISFFFLSLVFFFLLHILFSHFLLYFNAATTPSSQFFYSLLIKTLWYVIVAFFALLLRAVSTGISKKTDAYARRLVVVVAVECALLPVVEHRTQGTREAAYSVLQMM
jgi:hypothetical protein